MFSPKSVRDHTRRQWRGVEAEESRMLKRVRYRYNESQPNNNPDERDDRGQWKSYSELQRLNKEGKVEAISKEEADKIEREIQLEYSDNAIDSKVCAVTDVWVLGRSAVCVPIDDLPLNVMKVVLQPREWCTAPIKKLYDCTRYDERLANMMLSPRGIELREDGSVDLWISAKTLKELRAMQRSLNSGDTTQLKPPIFAVADCFISAVYPEIDALSVIEKQTLSLAQVRGVVKVVFGGPGNVLQSHLLCWDNGNSSIADQIPNDLQTENYHIIMAGPFTNQQELLVAKRHECCGRRVRKCYELLKAINPLYSQLNRNDTFFDNTHDFSKYSTRVSGDSDNELITAALQRQASVATMGHTELTPASENVEIESETVIVDTDPNRIEDVRLNCGLANLVGGVYVARRGTKFLSTQDPFYLEKLFPHLFPFGLGGFQAPRCHRYSKRSIVVHYLMHSSNVFAEDPIFKMLMFDMLSTERVKSSVFVRVGQNPDLAFNITKISPDQLRFAMDESKKRRQAARVGRPLASQSVGACDKQVLQSIKASASKMWGSNEEREQFSRKLDAMTLMFGQPSVFWTLTPNPNNSITAAFWTAAKLPGGRPKLLRDCTIANMPGKSGLSQIIMKNSVVQARYYQLCCEILLKLLFGWDVKASRPTRNRGVLGYAEAFFYAIEQQGRLTVHHHGVAWIAGMPKTKSDWERILNDHALKEQFRDYCDATFSHELPVFDDVEAIQCPREECDGYLAPLAIAKKYNHLLKPGTLPPIVAECGRCHKQFTEQDVNLSVIETQWRALPPDEQARSSETAVKHVQMKICGISNNQNTAKVQLSRILLKCQVHSHEHARSCVKGRVNTKCRYKYPRPIATETVFNVRNELEYRRRIGNQYLNGRCRHWARIFHDNSDCRFLWCGEGLQAHRYALSYTAKQQTVLDNAAIVELAFKRRIEREQLSRSTEFNKGVGRLMSLSLATSGVMEVGGPLAVTILLEGGAAHFSCTFERLVLIEGLNIMENKNVEVSVITGRDELFTRSTISLYMSRPNCLKNCNWYDYCSWFNTHNVNLSDECGDWSGDQTLLKQHIQKHGLRKYDFPHVPDIVGPRLPDSRCLENEKEKAELYYRMTLLLYHPFRDPRSFLDENRSAKAFYENWNPTTIPEVMRALEFHQQYYICLQAAQIYRQRQTQTEGDDSDVTDDDDIDYERAHATENAPHTKLLIVCEDLYDLTHENTCEDPDEGDSDHQAFEDWPTSSILLTTLGNQTLPDDDTMARTVLRRSITERDMQNFEHDCRNPAIGAAAVIPEGNEMGLLVEKLDDAVRNLQYDVNIGDGQKELKEYATVRDVSAHFHLNREQHYAFTLFSVPLLFRIAGVCIPEDLSHVFNNSPMIFTGAGGTGKSRIVDAVRALVKSWRRPNSVMIVGTTGIAAANLGGQTIHNSIGLGVNVSRLPKNLQHPDSKLQSVWDPVLGIMADEMSMADLGVVGIWEEGIRRLKENDDTFGGLVVAFMLDHLQLRTVRGKPLFVKEETRKPFTSAQRRASTIYHSISKVIYLKTNMRFLNDVQYGLWLADARVGRWQEEFKRFLMYGQLRAPNSTAEELVQIISTDNKTRVETNALATKIATNMLSRRVYIVRAEVSAQLAPKELETLRSMNDNQTGNILLFLPVYVGMWVRIKANQCVSKRVANGALGKVYHIDWKEGTRFSRTTKGEWMASETPANIYVDVENSTCNTKFPGLPPEWPVSVVPIAQMKTSFKINGKSITIRGFPIVPAYGTTVFGVQGETRNEVGIKSLRPEHIRHADRHSLYVALSRVTTRAGLYWLGPRLTEEDFMYFTPVSDALAEDARLARLAAAMEATIETHNATFQRMVNISGWEIAP